MLVQSHTNAKALPTENLLWGETRACSRRWSSAVRPARNPTTRADDLSVSNSLSGGDWELDEIPGVGDPAHVAQIGKRRRLSTDERRRCVSLQ
jgi:hypothetical protein